MTCMPLHSRSLSQPPKVLQQSAVCKGGGVRSRAISLWCIAVLAVGIVAVGWGGRVARAEVLFWTEGFESYPANSNIDGKDGTWSALYPEYGTVRTAPYPVHAGSRSLMATNGYGVAGYYYGPHWWDDTPSKPHGGLVALSWWMYVDASYATDPHWRISVDGWNGNTVAMIGNNEKGSKSSVDYQTTSGWFESFQDVVMNQWSHVSLQVDFSKNPDQYRFRVGDSGTWSNWLTLNTTSTNEDYFRKINLAGGTSSEYAEVFYDDMSGSVVPEPGVPSLLCTLGLSGFALFGMRRRKGSSCNSCRSGSA